MWKRLVLAAVVVLTACSATTSSVDDNKFPGEGTGDSSKWFTATSVDRTSMTLTQGVTGTFHITTTRGGGYTGTLYYSFTQQGSLGVTVTNIVTVGTTTDADVKVAIPPAWPPVTDFHFLLHISGTTSAVVNPGTVDLVVNVVKAP